MAGLLVVTVRQRTYRVHLFRRRCNLGALTCRGWVLPRLAFMLFAPRPEDGDEILTRRRLMRGRTIGPAVASALVLICLLARGAAADGGAADAVRHFYDVLLQTMRDA